MDVVPVDYGEPCERLSDEGKQCGVWKELICLTARIQIYNLKCNLIYRLRNVRTPECFNIAKVSVFVFFLSSSGWKMLRRLLKDKVQDVWNGKLSTKQWGPLIHATTSLFHYTIWFVENPNPSIMLYTYTWLRTPVFSVKQCYAYLYCMYSMYIPSFALELCSFYLPQSRNNNQYFEAKCLLLL